MPSKVYPFPPCSRLYDQKEVIYMFSCAGIGSGFWWIFPIIMLAMMVLCFFMMRGRTGAMMCRPDFRSTDGHGGDASSELKLTKKGE